MKKETTSAAIETTGVKQAWTEPTLITLAVSLETLATGTNGGDGGVVNNTLT